jgi:hypothetical protein
LESVPSSKRIIHDVKNVFKLLEIVCNEKGTKVDGVGNANVQVRYIPVSKKKSGRGGGRVREKDDYGDYTFVHKDATMQATKVKLEHSAQVNSGGNNNKNVKRAIREQKENLENQAKKAKND